MEDERAGDQQSRIGVGIVGRFGCHFGQGDVTGRLHEPPELGDRDRVVVHPEPVDGDLVDGCLLGIEVRGSHSKGATRNPGHVPRRRRTG